LEITVQWKIPALLILFMHLKEILALDNTMELTEPTIQEMSKNKLR
jgi:hypothetical protein